MATLIFAIGWLLTLHIEEDMKDTKYLESVDLIKFQSEAIGDSALSGSAVICMSLVLSHLVYLQVVAYDTKMSW